MIVEKSDYPLNGDLEITTVNGTVVDKAGRVKARVAYVYSNELMLCSSGRDPADGQTGVIYAERHKDGRYYVIDFEESRKH